MSQESPALSAWKGEAFAGCAAENCHNFYCAIASFVFQKKKALADNSLSPHADHKSDIERAHLPDGSKLGHGLAQLAAYAQREWLSQNIPCPLEYRLRSLYYATIRTCDGDPARTAARVGTLLDFALRLSYDPGTDSKELDAWGLKTANVKFDAKKALAIPLLEPIFEDATFTGEFWLKSLAARLKDHDYKAYERDIARASREYAVLLNKDCKPTSVEMVRIARPESLLFDFWAWQDFKNSCEHTGFPLVWIDSGWHLPNHVQLRLNRAPQTLKPLNEQEGLAALADVTASEFGYELRFPLADPRTRCDLSSNIRFLLKKHLFSSGTFQIATIPFDPKEQPAKKVELLEDAIKDSEVELPAKLASPPPVGYRWAQFTYSQDIDIFGTWAGDEIARIIYSPLRTTPDMRLPNDFSKLHVQRQPGLVSVWSREGLAVAVKQGDTSAADTARRLKDELTSSARLERDLQLLFKDGPPEDGEKKEEPKKKDSAKKNSPQEERRETTVRCTKTQMALKNNAALPEYRPLRQFLERRHLQEVYDAFRQTEADADQSGILHEMHESDQKMRWLETAIFSAYIAELSHLTAELVFQDELTRLSFVAGFSLSGLALAACWLLPKKRHKVWGFTLLAIPFAIFIIGLAYAYANPIDSSQTASKPEQKSAPPTPQKSTPTTPKP